MHSQGQLLTSQPHSTPLTCPKPDCTFPPSTSSSTLSPPAQALVPASTQILSNMCDGADLEWYIPSSPLSHAFQAAYALAYGLYGVNSERKMEEVVVANLSLSHETKRVTLEAEDPKADERGSRMRRGVGRRWWVCAV